MNKIISLFFLLQKEVNRTGPTVLPTTPHPPPQNFTTNQGKTATTTAGPSVYFNCGNTVCPLGTDCISKNGSERCADPCEYYTVLNDDWRATNNTSNQILHCDQNINWNGWYRMFLGQTSAQIPERCVGENKCGTHASMWITEPNPTQSGQIVMRTVCNAWAGSCCRFTTSTIHVKLCYGNYYVYKLVRPSTCNLAYCAGIVPFLTVTKNSIFSSDPSKCFRLV